MGDKIETLKEIFNDIEVYKELADIIIPVVSIYMDRTADGLTDLKIRQIKRYQNNGFTKQEAIMLTLDTNHTLTQSIKDYNKN